MIKEVKIDGYKCQLDENTGKLICTPEIPSNPESSVGENAPGGLILSAIKMLFELIPGASVPSAITEAIEKIERLKQK